MSLLIKALKQAERDHQARTGRADAPEPAPTQASEPSSLPRISLQLDPLEAPDAPQNAAMPPAASQREEFGASTTIADLDTDSYEAPAAPKPSSLMQTALAGAKAPGASVAAQEAGAAPAAPRETPFASAPLTEPTRQQPDRLSTPRSPTASAGRVAEPIPEAHDEPSAPATAVDEDRAQVRQAARQLMAPDPDRTRLRRKRMVLGLIAGFALAAIGYTLWQSGMPDFGAYTNGAARSRLAASAPPAPVAAPAASPAVGETKGPAHAPVKTSAAAGGPGAARTEAPKGAVLIPMPAPVSHPAQTQGTASTGPAQSDAAPSAATIHLRPKELSAEKIRAQLQEAYSAASRGDAIAAKKGYEQVINADPDNADAWIGLAMLAANSADADGASHYYRRALEIDPNDTVALAGLLGLQTGVQPQEYEARLRQFIARDGMQPVLLSALGKLLAREGRWLEAQEAFYEAWSADPTQPDVAFNLAVSLERIRQSDAAVAFYRRALQLTRDHSSHFDQALANDRINALLASAAPVAGGSARADGKARAMQK